MDGRITLIVKAANQSVPDQRLECDTEWTVLTLKDHLSTIHPSKPRVDEQRLIYSGQLLLDDLRLRNVLRHPTENNSYTIHLVCSPPRIPAPSAGAFQSVPVASRQQASPRRAGEAAAMTVPQQPEAPNPPAPPVSSSDSSVNSESTDGLRRRTVASDEASAVTHQGIEATTGYPTQAQVSMGVLQASADPIQQMATMQQMYANYMAYLQYIQMGGGLAGGVPWPQQMLHQFPSSPPTPSSPAQSAASAAAAVADQSDQQQQLPDQNVAPNQQQQQQQQQQPQAQAPQIRMNAQGGEVDDDDDENEGLGRDWLDWIYVLSRMVVLLSVVYFYSTVSRFMIVVCIALLLYLYQAGWFRPTRRAPEPPAREGNDNEANEAQDDRNNNINNNNNNNEVPNQLLADEVPEQAPQAQANEGDAAVGPVEGTDRGTEADELHVRPSLLALSWTFLTTFFTSLIPEQPQVI